MKIEEQEAQAGLKNACLVMQLITRKIKKLYKYNLAIRHSFKLRINID